jgi:hypothetical protein
MAAEERRADGDPGRHDRDRPSRRRDRHARPRSKEGPWVAKARDRTGIRGLPRFTSSRPGSLANSPLPDQARHAPTLRANPYPEVTDPICRLPLPTLFYRLEALHLGDLLRIWVRAGATPPRGPLPDFQGPSGIPAHRRNCGALRVPNPISLREDSRELERSCRKENSFRGPRRRLRALLGCPDEPLARARRTTVPLPGSGIGTGFPFARSMGLCLCESVFPIAVCIGFLLGLRID